MLRLNPSLSDLTIYTCDYRFAPFLPPNPMPGAEMDSAYSFQKEWLSENIEICDMEMQEEKAPP